MLHDVRSIQILEGKSILDAMKAINKSGSKFGLIVDKKDRLVGMVTDGDIRRGIIDGHDLKEPIRSIMNASPAIVREGLTTEVMSELVNNKFAQVPVVDGKGRVKGIITFNDKNLLMDVRSRKICILGLGYVGLTLSFALAEVGFKILGYDINDGVIKKIQGKLCPFHENGLEAYLRRHVGNNFEASSEFNDCAADTYIITVGTPVSVKAKVPHMGHIKEAAERVGRLLKADNLVILRSTVPVGTTRDVVLPILEKLSGLKAGIDFYLSYAPERTIAGNAIPELTKLPQVIGGYDERSALMTDRLFREITSTVVDVGSLEGAEMIKIIHNTFRDVKFAYANELALICKELNLDMLKLVQAANFGYIRDEIPVPSPGVGGPCLTKDPYILMHSCRNLKFKPGIVKLSREVNEFIPLMIAQEIEKKINKLNKNKSKLKVFVLGFAFKGEPETSDVCGSTTVDLLNCMRKKGYKDSTFYGYDPVVSREALKKLKVAPVSVDKGFKNADIVMIMNNHKSYKHLDIFNLLKTVNHGCIFMDGWRTFEPGEIKTIPGIEYIGMGV